MCTPLYLRPAGRQEKVTRRMQVWQGEVGEGLDGQCVQQEEEVMNTTTPQPTRVDKGEVRVHNEPRYYSLRVLQFPPAVYLDTVGPHSALAPSQARRRTVGDRGEGQGQDGKPLSDPSGPNAQDLGSGFVPRHQWPPRTPTRGGSAFGGCEMPDGDGVTKADRPSSRVICTFWLWSWNYERYY